MRVTLNVYFAGTQDSWATYEAPLTAALTGTGLDCTLSTEMAPETVDHMVYAPNGPVRDFSPFTGLRAVHNLWAGVEDVVGNTTLHAPLARMVDDEGLTQGMVEWVTGHVLRHHLGMDAHIVNPGHVWDPVPPPLSADRPVTILGLGALGSACARALRDLGFPVTGWSRTPKRITGVTSMAGGAELARALRGAQIVVLLLPLTRATENVLDASALALLAPGAFVINPGRGPLIDDDALLAALASGHVAHATLDVFRTEPLPADHPYWTHPQVTVTPHIASETRPESAARVIAENIRRFEAGKPMLHVVDPKAGY
jgi:glyoxylate/hydroxypyruvate reductase A